VVDPRKPRGLRHGLVAALTAAVCAVAAGARSFVAVAEWVADLPAELAVALWAPDQQADRIPARWPRLSPRSPAGTRENSRLDS
jgi:hypothetical protein